MMNSTDLKPKQGELIVPTWWNVLSKAKKLTSSDSGLCKSVQASYSKDAHFDLSNGLLHRSLHAGA